MIDFRLSLLQSIASNNSRMAFVICGKSYSYHELGVEIAAVQRYILSLGDATKRIGVLCDDTLTTYAAVLSIMLLDKTFIPILRHYPNERNGEIIRLAEIDCVIDFNEAVLDRQTYKSIEIVPTAGNPLAILFTSGSTGKPKGVPYKALNINATVDAYFRLGMDLGADDRFLQMFDLNFDMSYLSFMPALLIGASVFTVGHGGIKYLEAVKLLLHAQITVATVVPSTLQLLKPYFGSLQLPHLKYTLVGGEPFSQQLANGWFGCTPNNKIYNISGPTETTMACMGYWVPRAVDEQKTHNGILAFGTPWPNTKALVIDDNHQPLPPLEVGNLAFSGLNVMDGYLALPEVNQLVFCNINGERYYKTGDRAFVDNDGIFHTCGRADNQVKILGFKVELGEIEYHASEVMGGKLCVVKYYPESKELKLFVEKSGQPVDCEPVLIELKQRVPSYMVPSAVIEIDSFPTTNNGKIDKSKL